MCLVAQSCQSLRDPMDCSPPGSSAHRDSPGKNTGVRCHALLQGTFPTQKSNSGLSHCRQILYCLRHQGSCPPPHALHPFNIALVLSTQRTWLHSSDSPIKTAVIKYMLRASGPTFQKKKKVTQITAELVYRKQCWELKFCTPTSSLLAN